MSQTSLPCGPAPRATIEELNWTSTGSVTENLIQHDHLKSAFKKVAK